MNGLLGLTAEFLERAAGPAHGADVNDLYGGRLKSLLAVDPGAAAVLSNLELAPDDLPSLSVDAWLWYLRWCGDVPGADFLDALFEATDEPAVHARIVEITIRQPDAYERLAYPSSNRPPPPLDELPLPWLRSRLERALNSRASLDTDAGRLDEAELLVISLLALGDPASLGVLRALFADPLARETGVDAFARSYLAASGIEEQELDPLLRELGLDG